MIWHELKTRAIGALETLKGVIEFASHPVETLNALSTLVKEGKLKETVKQSFLDRIETLKIQYEKAGASGAYNAGVETGKLLQETIGIFAGGVGVAKVGAKVVKELEVITKNTVSRVKNYSVLNKVISEVDNVAISTEKGFINASKICQSACELKPTNALEKDIIDKILINGDSSGRLTEQLINNLAKRSGYTPVEGGKYGSNNGFDHVLVGKDGSIVIIDSKQIRNGAIQISSKGVGGTNQLSPNWIKNVVDRLPDNDLKLMMTNAINSGKPIKTIVAGVDKSDGSIKLIPVEIPNSIK